MNHYQRLGVASTATLAEIKAARRALAMKYHPDRTGNDPEAQEKLKDINLAFRVLSDPEQRAKYDLQLGMQPAQPPRAGIVSEAAGSAFDWIVGRAQRASTDLLSQKGPVGQKAAKGADILFDVGRDLGKEGLKTLFKGRHGKEGR